MKVLERNQKVYIISKLWGDSLRTVKDREAQRRPNSLSYETININGNDVEALVGYFNKMDCKTIFVLDYRLPAITGDFYLENDFLTEYEMKMAIYVKPLLPDSLFEI